MHFVFLVLRKDPKTVFSLGSIYNSSLNCLYLSSKKIYPRSFVKTKERLEKEQAVIQAIEKISTENNAQELLASSLLVPSQQSSGLGTLNYKAVVESMTNVESTRSRGSYTKFTDVDRFEIGRYAGENGNKKALIHFKSKFPGGEFSKNF